jgi:hypothetical protein
MLYVLIVVEPSKEPWCDLCDKLMKTYEEEERLEFSRYV